jgi:hypothetical protein
VCSVGRETVAFGGLRSWWTARWSATGGRAGLAVPSYQSSWSTGGIIDADPSATMPAMLVTTPDSPLCLDKARVICPHTDKLSPEVFWALQASGNDFEMVDVGGSDSAYYELVSGLWRAQRSFTLVEHDIVVSWGTLASFNNCGHEWCASKYTYLRGNYWGLGCTRFRAPLLKRYPDLMDEVGEYDAPNHGKRHWCSLDQALTTSLKSRKVDWPHVHGEVRHLSDGQPAHGCRTK